MPEAEKIDLQWLQWSKRLVAIAQIGLTYSNNEYDIERFKEIQKIAAEIISLHSELPIQKLSKAFSLEIGYATPKVDVRGVVFKNNKILLVKEREDALWSLPGGWADINESPREAIEREIFEESGYRTKATKLLAIFDRAKHPHHPPFLYHVYKLFFHCSIIDGTAQTSNEIAAIDFFDKDSIPELSISRVTPEQIKHFFKHYENQSRPTDFD